MIRYIFYYQLAPVVKLVSRDIGITPTQALTSGPPGPILFDRVQVKWQGCLAKKQTGSLLFMLFPAVAVHSSGHWNPGKLPSPMLVFWRGVDPLL